MTKQINLWSKSKYRNNGGYFCRRRRAILDAKCCSECQYHPSRLELNTARILYSRLPVDSVIAHPKLEVKPATATFPSITWNVDFQVDFNGQDSIYVETKGAVTEGFELRLKFLEYVYPDAFKRVLVVGSKSLELIKGVHQIGINEFERNLFTYLKSVQGVA